VSSFEHDIKNKTYKFQAICETVNILKGETMVETKNIFYKALAAYTLLCDSESWTLRKRKESPIQSAEMAYSGSVKG
jgi:hypothetical protein